MSAQQATPSIDGLAAWKQALQATRVLTETISRLPRDAQRTAALAADSLAKLDERRVALLTLLQLDPAVCLDLLEELVGIAAQSHRDASLVRRIIGRLPRADVSAHLPPFVMVRLSTADDDEYRRLAELARHLGQEVLLRELVSKASASTDPHVREVGEDFSPPD